MRTLEDDQRIDVVARLLPERVGARDVGAQHAGRRVVAGVEEERNAVGVDAAGAVLRHQQAERVGGDEVAQHLRTRFGEMGGKVHRRDVEARPQYAGVYLSMTPRRCGAC